MLEVAEILKQLGSRSKWLVLWALFREEGLSGRKVAERVGLSWAPVKRTLDELLALGLITRRSRFNAYSYYLNRKHYLFPALEVFFSSLFNLGEIFFAAVKEQFSEEKPLSLKVSAGKAFLIVGYKGPSTQRKWEEFLASKGLAKIILPVVVSLQEKDKIQEITLLEGKTFGVPFRVLATQKREEEKLTFFKF